MSVLAEMYDLIEQLSVSHRTPGARKHNVRTKRKVRKQMRPDRRMRVSKPAQARLARIAAKKKAAGAAAG